MREILFRGKTVREVWVYGLLAHVGNAWYISNSAGASTAYEVIPSTIEQYTGLKDKNGKKIFEGDIVKQTFEGRNSCSPYWDDEYEDFEGHKIGRVTFSGTGAHIICEHGKLYLDGEKVEDWKPSRRSRLSSYRCEVIGNIHDNPELLEVEHEVD